MVLITYKYKWRGFQRVLKQFERFKIEFLMLKLKSQIKIQSVTEFGLSNVHLRVNLRPKQTNKPSLIVKSRHRING